MEMILSGITTSKEGEKQAHIRFEDGVRMAEGTIPSCVITKNKGFSIEEVLQLQAYLEEHLSELKKQAAALSPFRAMMREDAQDARKA